MAYQYGQSAAPETHGQPRCWSDDRWFNPQSRDCRTCSYQTSCRDEIVRIRNKQTAVAPPPVVYQYGTQVAPQVTPPAAVVPYQQRPTGVQTAPPQQAQQVPQQANSIYPVPQRFQYGWLTDPLYYQMSQSPRPPRPQFQGESFFVAAAKDMVLSAAETFFMHCFLTVRQIAWEPEQPPVPPIIDVNK